MTEVDYHYVQVKTEEVTAFLSRWAKDGWRLWGLNRNDRASIVDIVLIKEWESTK